MSMPTMLGKKVVITGGTNGIGRAIAILFAKEGSDIVIVGTNEERGREVINSMIECQIDDSQNFIFNSVDVSNNGEVESFSKNILSKWGFVDILINCAGITRDKLFITMKEEDWDIVMDTNLKSVYNVVCKFLRTMIKRRYGKIINISSVVGVIGNAGQVNYAASKAGMIGMTRALAVELASRNICVNCIAPGFIDSEMTKKLSDEQKNKILERVPLGRFGSLDDIANVALFLASKSSDYITGQVLIVDGGLTS